MAFSLFPSERRSATCSICGHEARPGAKLCPACKAALKRARHDATVSQLQPMPRKPETSSALSAIQTPRPSRARRTPARDRSAVAPAPPRRRLPSVLIVSGIAVAALGVAATIVRHDAGVAIPAHMLPAPAAPGAPVGVRGGEDPSLPAATAAIPAGEAGTKPPAPADGRVPAPTARAGTAPAGRAAMRPAPSPAGADSIEAFGPVAEPRPAEPVALPPPREAPAPDRWQQFADAIGQCEGESFIGRVVCEQRARLAACDGYWGQVPQCQTINRTDYGQ